METTETVGNWMQVDDAQRGKAREARAGPRRSAVLAGADWAGAHGVYRTIPTSFTEARRPPHTT